MIKSKITLCCTLLTCIVLSMGCNNSNKQEFTVFYFCGDFETSAQITCADFERMCMASEYDDTVFIDSDVAEQIKNAVADAQPTDDSQNPLSPIMYVKTADQDLCLNRIDNLCWIKQDNGAYRLSILSNEVAYLLKCKSKYYNYLPDDILESDNGIKQYGVPADYNKVQSKKTEKPKEAAKVLIKVI
ncbi:MAG: hypothetical protein Q4D41_06035 [Prevotellaceae bacterium]|nr:hypothetical protein [Prevotellaceae bacterium]